MHPVTVELKRSRAALAALVSRVYYLQGQLKRRDKHLDATMAEAEQAIESNDAVMTRIEGLLTLRCCRVRCFPINNRKGPGLGPSQ